MSRAKRKERRERRRVRRAKRRDRVQNIIQKGKELNFIPDDIEKGDYQSYFKYYWPTFKEVLLFLKELKITRKKADQTLTEIIVLGDAIESGDESAQSKFQEKMAQVWRLLRVILNIVTVFTKEKADDVLEKIIEVGDWLSGLDQEEEDEGNTKLDIVKE